MPVRVLIWAPYGAGPHYWGPGHNAWRLVEHMQERYGQDCVFDLAHGFKGQSPENAFQNRHYLSELVSGDLKSLAVFLKTAKRWLAAHAREYDVLHAVSCYDAGLLPASWFRRYNPAGMATVRIATRGEGLWPGSLRSRLFLRHRIRRQKAKRLSAIVALSQAIESGLHAIPGLPEVVRIPNGVDTTRFAPPTPEQKRNARKVLEIDDCFTVLFVGSISERKQPHVLVEALTLLPASMPVVQLVLAGPTREGTAEAHRIDALLERTPALRTRVHQVGFREDTTVLYHSADVFALPSQKEGMSNALLEAQSSGLPALVTDVSGSADIVKHGETGYLVRATAREIAERIAELAGDDAKREYMGRDARARIAASFSVESAAQQYAALWQINKRTNTLKHP